jgi:FtsP/CotA-like multicopper oxidase with cupredoxin domain
MKLTRRDLLRLGIMVGGGAVLAGGRRVSRASDLPASPRLTPFLVELVPGRGIPDIKQPVAPFPTLPDPQDCINPDGSVAFHTHGPRAVPPGTEFFLVHERPVAHSFHPELPLNVLWGYDGQIPGPTFIARSGTAQLVRFVNDLPEHDPVGIGEPITAIHRHGGFQAPEDDGYPLDTFCGGQSRDYLFPNRPDGGLAQNEHSTNWYHDHAIDITAQNVYRGLAGFYLYRNAFDTGDETDPPPNLRLPSGDFDIGLVLQDRQFDRNGFLVYDSFDHDGFIGDTFCVNGLVQPFLRVARRRYRLRFLNGSNARVYQLFLSTGQPFVAVSTDSNLLPAAVEVPSVRLAPAERVDVVVDFRDYPINTEVFLVNRLVQTDGRKPDGLVSRGTQLMKFLVDRNVDTDPSRDVQDGDVLLPVTEGPAELLPQVRTRRRFKLDRSNGAWTINGQFFDENRINARPTVGRPEIWTFESGGGWVHPVHIHLSSFFVLSRDGKQPPKLERGRKEVILVGGDVSRDARILIKFEEFTGRYVFHCHNVEHEDMRMMAQFEVQP